MFAYNFKMYCSIQELLIGGWNCVKMFIIHTTMRSAENGEFAIFPYLRKSKFFVSVHKNAKKELGQYPAILTSRFVNNAYIALSITWYKVVLGFKSADEILICEYSRLSLFWYLGNDERQLCSLSQNNEIPKYNHSNKGQISYIF